MVWIRPEELLSWRGVISNRPAAVLTNTVEILLSGFTTGGIFVRVSGASDSYAHTASVLALNTWSHVAFVFNGTAAIQIFHNGSQISATSVGTPPATTAAQTQAMVFGQLGDWAGYGYNGRISNVLFFNRVLGGKEINYWRTRYLTGRENGLIGYYPHLDRTGTTLMDWSRNKKHGTITGASWVKGS